MSSPSDLFGAGAPGPKRLRSVEEPEPSERWSINLDFSNAADIEIQRTQRAKGSPTLGIFRPKTITRLAMEPTSDEWNAREMAILNRTLLPFQLAPAKQLEKNSI